MGYYYPNHVSSRRELIADLTKDAELPNGRTRTCLRHCCRGNVLWSVVQINHPDGSHDRWIACDLLHRAGDGIWGYKPMDEAVHPYYYTCPLSYLKMTPVANAEWRKIVMEKHARAGTLTTAK